MLGTKQKWENGEQNILAHKIEVKRKFTSQNFAEGKTFQETSVIKTQGIVLVPTPVIEWKTTFTFSKVGFKEAAAVLGRDGLAAAQI